jgi:hypothetical protein
MYAYIFGSGGQSVSSPSGTGGAGGGYKWGGDLDSGVTVNYAASDATYTDVWQVIVSSAFGYILPTTGNIYCQYNQWVGATDNLYILMSVSDATAQFTMHGEIVGDLPMGNINLSSFVAGGTVLANTYQLYTVPRTAFMIPQSGWGNGFGDASAVGVLQHAFYKFLVQEGTGKTPTYKIAKCWFGP